MAQSKISARSTKSGHESSSSLQASSYGDSFSYTYSTYGSGSEPNYIKLEIRIKHQADEIGHLQKQNNRLVEDLDMERSQGMQRLKKLDSAAKTAEKRTQELSVELERSREIVKHYQELNEALATQIQEMAAARETQDDRKRVEARIQQLEAEIAQTKEEIKNGNYESTQQRAAIRKAQEEKCIAQRLLEASEKERNDLAKRLAELERLNGRQERAMSGAAQGWLRKNREIDAQREDLRWRMVDTTKGGSVGLSGQRREQSAASKKSPTSAKAQARQKSGKAAAQPLPAIASASSVSGSDKS